MGVGDDVGEVDLALVVVRAQGRQGGAQVGGVEDVDAGVDLADGALGLAGVALLDDGRDGAVGLAHDAPVAGGVLELGGQQGDGIPALMVLSQELLQGGGVQQRDVPAGDDDGAIQVLGQGGQPAGDGPPGAGHLVLVGRDGVGGDLGEVGDDGVALVTHNDDEVLGLQPPGRGDGVVQQAATADPVQDLGGDRSHTSSLACGHDDDGGGCGWRHVSSSHRFAPGLPTSPAATGRRPGTDSNGF